MAPVPIRISSALCMSASRCTKSVVDLISATSASNSAQSGAEDARAPVTESAMTAASAKARNFLNMFFLPFSYYLKRVSPV